MDNTGKSEKSSLCQFIEGKTNRLVLILGIALVYFLAAKFGLSLAIGTKQVTTFWPPTGIALAALLLFGENVWPGVMLGAFAANILTHETALVALGIGFGNTLEAIVGVLIIKSVKKDFSLGFAKLTDYLTFLLAVQVSTALGATLG